MSMMILHRRIELGLMLATVFGMVVGRRWRRRLRRTGIRMLWMLWVLRMVRSGRGQVRCRVWKRYAVLWCSGRP